MEAKGGSGAKDRDVLKLLRPISAFTAPLSSACTVRNVQKGFEEIGFGRDERDDVTLDAETVFRMCPTFMENDDVARECMQAVDYDARIRNSKSVRSEDREIRCQNTDRGHGSSQQKEHRQTEAEGNS